MDRVIHFMGLEIPVAKLATKAEVLAALYKDSSFASLEPIRERYEVSFGSDLAWRYPISDGTGAGAIFMPVQEGFLWMPYDEMDKEFMEIITYRDIQLLDFKGASVLYEEYMSYSNQLLSALSDACFALRQNVFQKDVNDCGD